MSEKDLTPANEPATFLSRGTTMTKTSTTTSTRTMLRPNVPVRMTSPGATPTHPVWTRPDSDAKQEDGHHHHDMSAHPDEKDDPKKDSKEQAGEENDEHEAEPVLET